MKKKIFLQFLLSLDHTDPTIRCTLSLQENIYIRIAIYIKHSLVRTCILKYAQTHTYTRLSDHSEILLICSSTKKIRLIILFRLFTIPDICINFRSRFIRTIFFDAHVADKKKINLIKIHNVPCSVLYLKLQFFYHNFSLLQICYQKRLTAIFLFLNLFSL